MNQKGEVTLIVIGMMFIFWTLASIVQEKREMRNLKDTFDLARP